jgi:hypothetical protein
MRVSSNAADCGTRLPERVCTIDCTTRTYATKATVGESSLTVGCEMVEVELEPRPEALSK